MSEQINRRNVLKFGLGTASAFFFASSIPKAIAASCGLTPPQTPGPFYPGEELFEKNNDLTFLPGATQRAQGQVIYIRGTILNQKCEPVPNVQVEIWQACASGKYNNPTDPNPAPLDPHFKYWGETISDAKGEYVFKTIQPGAYPADVDWMRPPHIHFKLACLGYQELVTQLYFKGNEYNAADQILIKVPANERDRVVIDFENAPVGFDLGSKLGVFDVTLQSVR